MRRGTIARVIRVIEGLSTAQWVWGVVSGLIASALTRLGLSFEWDEAILLGLLASSLLWAFFVVLRSSTPEYAGGVADASDPSKGINAFHAKLEVPNPSSAGVYRARVTRIGNEVDLMPYAAPWQDNAADHQRIAVGDKGYVELCAVQSASSGLFVVLPFRPGWQDESKGIINVHSPRMSTGPIEMTVLVSRDDRERIADEVDLLIGYDTRMKPFTKVLDARRITPHDRR